jgi:hypothetical protein
LPTELGALIWTLIWGSDERFRHNLGMAKAFGFGQVKLEIVDSDIRANQIPEKKIALDDKYYMNLFRKLMGEEYAAEKQRNNTQNMSGEWDNSEQVRLLKTMANPEYTRAKKENLKHLQLEDSQRKNQFVVAKQEGLVLPEYGLNSNRDQQLFPRTTRKRPIPKPTQISQSAESNPVNQWIETTLDELRKQKRLPATNPLCSKAIAEKWQLIKDLAFKKAVCEEISQRWTNMIPDDDVDWWQVPPSNAMKRIKKIYEQG